MRSQRRWRNFNKHSRSKPSDPRGGALFAVGAGCQRCPSLEEIIELVSWKGLYGFNPYADALCNRDFGPRDLWASWFWTAWTTRTTVTGLVVHEGCSKAPQVKAIEVALGCVPFGCRMRQ